MARTQYEVVYSCHILQLWLGACIRIISGIKNSNASSISDTSATVGYGKTRTGQPLSSNCSNLTSINFFGLDNIETKASWELFLAFISMIRPWTDCLGPSWKILFKHLPLSGTNSSVLLSTPLSPSPSVSCYFSASLFSPLSLSMLPSFSSSLSLSMLPSSSFQLYTAVYFVE